MNVLRHLFIKNWRLTFNYISLSNFGKNFAKIKFFVKKLNYFENENFYLKKLNAQDIIPYAFLYMYSWLQKKYKIFYSHYTEIYNSACKKLMFWTKELLELGSCVFYYDEWFKEGHVIY